MYFIHVLKRLKYLEKFTFQTNPELFAEPPPYHLLTDLPIKSIFSNDFELGRDTIDQVIDTLDQIESLNEVVIWLPIWNDYLLSPEDLLKFKDQPLSDIDPEALDITKENIPEFREVIKELGIRDSLQKVLMNELDKIETQFD